MPITQVRPLLNDIFYLASRSPILAYKKVGALLEHYKTSDKPRKIAILDHLAKEYHPAEEQVAAQLRKEPIPSTQFVQSCAHLHAATEPKYSELFRLIGRQPDGVRSLVHLRADLLRYSAETTSPAHIKRMSDVLRDLLATWFSTGLLQVQRVTWQSPCEIGRSLFSSIIQQDSVSSN